MAVRRSGVALLALFVAGCAARPAPAIPSSPSPLPQVESPRDGRPRAIPEPRASHRAPREHAETGAAAETPSREQPGAVRAEAAACREPLANSRSALDREIDRRAEDLRSGPIGSRASELASRRLVAAACDLLDSDSPAGARQALDHAVSLDGRNGYAYLWLGCLARAGGDAARAAEALASARRFLPEDHAVRAELGRLEGATH